MEKLTSETLSDILLKLPVDSLSESRYVCKLWSYIIYDPYFVNKHLQLMQTQNKDLGIIIPMKTDVKNDFELYYAEYDDEKLYKITKINRPPIKFNDPYFKDVDSCNGLICITDQRACDPFYVCNPMTGESLTLSLPKFSSTEDINPIVDTMRGFGYSHTTNEYMVVAIMIHQRPDTILLPRQVMVYTVGKDTNWRKKGKAPPDLLKYYYNSGVLVNGALHWMTELHFSIVPYGGYHDKIIAFDLANEEFRVVPSPPCFKPGSNYADLVQLGGYLCVTLYSKGECIEIWMMKDYLSKGSLWTKEYTIQWEVNHRYRYKVFAVTKDGGVLLWRNEVVLVHYDPKTETLKDIQDHGKQRMLGAATHTKSFVSLKAIREDPRKIGEKYYS